MINIFKFKSFMKNKSILLLYILSVGLHAADGKKIALDYVDGIQFISSKSLSKNS